MNYNGNIIVASFHDLWAGIVAGLPEIIGAIIIIIIGLIVAPILGKIAKKLLQMVKMDELSEKMKVQDMFEKADIQMTFSGLIGGLVKWFFLIGFFIAAVDTLGWTQVTLFLNEIVFYIPNVIAAVILVAVGLIAGQFVGDVVTKGLKASSTPIRKPELLGKLAKAAVIVFAVLAAILQLGVAEQLVMILFGGVVLALALAFGLGGKAKAAKFLDKLDSTE